MGKNAGQVWVEVGADTNSLERDIARMQDSLRRSMRSVQDSISSVHFDEMAQDAGRALKKIGQETSDWVSRHKLLVGSAVAATAAIWMNNNPGEAKRYWNEISSAATKTADTIKESYNTASASVSDFAAKAKTAYDTIGQDAARATQEAANHFGAAGVEAGTYLAGKGIGAAGDVAYSHGKEAADLAVDMKRLSDFSGQSMTTLSALRSVADQTGISFSTLSSTFETMTSNMSGETDAAKMAQDQMADWGISIKDEFGELRDGEEVFADLAEKVQGFNKEGDNAAKVVAGLKNILGTIDKNSLDLLSEGGAAVTARLEEASRTGAIFTSAMAEAMNRIKKEQDAETAETKAWALAEKIIFAELGANLKAVANDLIWGQKSLGQSINDAWSTIGDSTGKYIDHIIGYYQKFLVFMDRTSKELAKVPGMGWMRSEGDALARAAALGPGQGQVVKALYGRNPDGSPILGSSHGSVQPPAALVATAAESATGPSAEAIEKFRLAAQSKIEELGLKIKEAQVKAGGGSKEDLEVLKIQIQARKELTVLERMAVDAGEKGSKDLLDQAKALTEEWMRQEIALAQLEAYWSKWQDWATYAKDLAGATGVGQADAGRNQNWLNLQKVLSSGADQNVKDRSYSLYSAQESKAARDQVAETAKLREQYASMTGNAQDMYGFQVQTLEADKEIAQLNREAAKTDEERSKWTAKIAVDEEQIRQAKLHQEGGWGGMKSALEEYSRTANDTFSHVKNATVSAFNSMTDALTNFVMTGKMNFTDFANSIIKDLIRMAIQAQVTAPLAAAVGGGVGSFFSGSGILGSIGSMFGAAPSGANSQAAWDIIASKHHAGGMAGHGQHVSADPAIFANARRYHSGGLAGDEVPAILQTGERVLSRQETAAYGKAPTVNITVQDQSGSISSGKAGSPKWDGDKWVLDVVLKASRNKKGFRNAFGMGGM